MAGSKKTFSQKIRSATSDVPLENKGFEAANGTTSLLTNLQPANAKRGSPRSFSSYLLKIKTTYDLLEFKLQAPTWSHVEKERTYLEKTSFCWTSCSVSYNQTDFWTIATGVRWVCPKNRLVSTCDASLITQKIKLNHWIFPMKVP